MEYESTNRMKRGSSVVAAERRKSATDGYDGLQRLVAIMYKFVDIETLI